jgi:hypothetical protein
LAIVDLVMNDHDTRSGAAVPTGVPWPRLQYKHVVDGSNTHMSNLKLLHRTSVAAATALRVCHGRLFFVVVIHRFDPFELNDVLQ